MIRGDSTTSEIAGQVAPLPNPVKAGATGPQDRVGHIHTQPTRFWRADSRPDLLNWLAAIEPGVNALSGSLENTPQTLGTGCHSDIPSPVFCPSPGMSGVEPFHSQEV